MYVRLKGTGQVYAIEGPTRFWDCQPIGSRVRCTEVIAQTWPEKQRILDMVSDEGPWERIEAHEFGKTARAASSLGMELFTQRTELTPKKSVPLAPLTTFGVKASAQWFVEACDVSDVREALTWASTHSQPLTVLGGGSNMLLHQDVEGLVLRIAIKGVELVQEDGEHVQVSAGAGEVWHDFVMHTLDQGWGGLENLSLIPGSVGASPMQNIGAYGVEIKDHFAWLDAVNVADGSLKRFGPEECDFGYRESVFKRGQKDRWVIVRVAFNLQRNAPLRMGYGAIEQELQHVPVSDRTARDVSEAVIRIRQSKLPDPSVVGNAGSFFKNPTVSASVAESLLVTYPDMPHFPQLSGDVKLAAGWLIEQAGWKGVSRGTHGVHDKQALVLVNHGGATGAEVWQLAQDVMASVADKFGVHLEPEVNQIGL